MALGQTVISGTKEITVENTAERVRTTSSETTGVSVKAASANTAVVHLGGESVGATSYSLEPNESLEFDIIDLSRVYVYGKKGDKVEFLGLEP